MRELPGDEPNPQSELIVSDPGGNAGVFGSCRVPAAVEGSLRLWEELSPGRRADLDGSNLQDLVTCGLSSPNGLALDVAGGKIYWTDRGTDKIQRAGLNVSNLQDLVTSGLSSPTRLDLDAAGGKIYWTDEETDKLQRENLDGTGIEDLLTGSDGLVDPSGIALGAEAVSGSN